ncbi:hypothetical protein V8F20_001675 [Naviculisporaceae sp. PSN 640]
MRGRRDQPASLYSSSSETIDSASLMGSMLSSIGVNIPETVINHDAKNTRKLRSGAARPIESKPTCCQNRSFQETIQRRGSPMYHGSNRRIGPNIASPMPVDGQNHTTFSLAENNAPNMERRISEKHAGSFPDPKAPNSYTRETKLPTKFDENGMATLLPNTQNSAAFRRWTLSRRSFIALIISGVLVGIISAGSTILLVVHIQSHSRPVSER